MINSALSANRSTRRLDVGGGGGGGGISPLIIVLLVIVIVGSLFATYKFLWGGGGDGGSKDGTPFYCTQCEKVFYVESYLVPAGGGYKPDCPLCDAKNSGAQMTRCPNCKEYYYLEPGAEPICPKCDTNRRKWYAERLRRGGRGR